MNNEEKIKQVVLRYIKTIHTQNKEDFYSLWAKNEECALISIGMEFRGVDTIYEQFLAGAICNAYSSIYLIADDISVREVTENLAIVVFRYHTECIRRNTGEEYGIQGLETQVIIKEEREWKLQHVHYSAVPSKA